MELMVDEPDRLTLRYLRNTRHQAGPRCGRARRDEDGVGRVERDDVASVQVVLRMDRIDGRLDRIERRVGMVESG
jgi:hypothetical protein